MKEITNSNDLIDFVNHNKRQGKGMQGTALACQADLSRKDLFQLGSILAYDDTLVALRKPDAQLVWHVAMPKSGSTWVSSVLKKGLETRNWRTTNLVPAHGRREQQLVPIELLRQNSLDNNIFAPHQHCMHSQYAFDFIKKFNVKLILQVRSIPDCIVSLIDHFDKGVGEGPFAFLNNHLWSTYDTNQKLNFVVDLILPWYINFWVGWSHGIEQENLNHKLINYKDILDNTYEEFGKLAKFCDKNIRDSDVDTWLQKAQSRDTRKNKAISGRGADLPEWVHQHIQRLVKYYPDVDFSYVGIHRN